MVLPDFDKMMKELNTWCEDVERDSGIHIKRLDKFLIPKLHQLVDNAVIDGITENSKLIKKL